MSRARPAELVSIAIVVALALLAFARAWSFGLTYLDDNDIVLTNADMLAKWASVGSSFTHRYFLNETNAYYRPLVNLSFIWDAHWAGARPWLYHVTNSGLHACACVLLFALLRRLAMGRAPALVAACLFAVHPMHVASVVWIPGRNDLLLGIFSLGALILLENSNGGWGMAAAHWLCFAAALLCKETAVCLPIVFAAMVLGPCSNYKSRHLLALGAAWAATLIGYFWLHRRVVELPHETLAKALGVARTHPLAVVSELGKVFLPMRLQVVATIKDLDIRPGICALVAVTMLVIGLRRELRVRVLLVVGGLILLPLVMALFASDFVMLENRLYLPVAGACLFIAECLHALGRKSPGFGRIAVGVATGVVLVFGVTAYRYSANFRDRYAFSEAAITAAPSSYLAMWLQAQRSFQGSHGPPKASTSR